MKLWKRLLAKIPELPRGWKTIRNLALTALTLLAIYMFIGAPAFSLELAFRREEKRHFVGPAEIVAIMDTAYTYYDKLIIADDNEGVIFGETMGNTIKRFHYRTITDDTAIMVLPDEFWNLRDSSVRIIVWNNEATATSAVLNLTLGSELDSIAYVGDYSLEATREHPRFFLFTLAPIREDQFAAAEMHALRTLQQMADPRNIMHTTFPAVVSFFTADNELLAEIELGITSEY